MWAAGLFEGEGCITHNGKASDRVLCPKLILCSADRDVVKRFHSAVGDIGYFRPRGGRLQEHHRYQWEWRVMGFEKVQSVVAMLWMGLGERRKARAKEILSIHLAKTPKQYPKD